MNIVPEIAALGAEMDAVLPIGARYWVTLAEQQLPVGQASA